MTQQSDEPRSRGRLLPKDRQSRYETILGLTLSALVSILWLTTTRDPSVAVAQSTPIPELGSLSFAGIGLLFVLVALYALVVCAEASVELLKPVHVRHMKEIDPDKAHRLQELLEGRQQFIASSSIASFSVLTLMILMCLTLAPIPGGKLEHLGLATGYWALLLGAVIIAIPVAVIALVFGQLAPRSYASLHPIRTCLALYRPLKTFALLFALPTSLITGLANLLTARFGAKASFVLDNAVEEEIRTIVETAEESGEIEEEESELLHSVFEFGDTVAREVMTPRVDIDALPVKSKPDQIIALINSSGHSRIPLFEDTDDQIVGIVHAKDILRMMALGDTAINIRKLMRTPLFVPENKGLQELLGDMRTHKTQLAVVQDEFGGTAGIVTIEDIVEELVGDIVDEYDEEQPQIIALGEGLYSVDAKTHVDDVNHELGSEFISEEFDTIGGYVFGLFGKQPSLGDSISDESYDFEVTETDGRRILRLKIRRQTLGSVV